MKETPQQKYQRLLHEVQELTTEVEKIKVTINFSSLSVMTCIAKEDLLTERERFPKLLDKRAEVSKL